MFLICQIGCRAARCVDSVLFNNQKNDDRGRMMIGAGGLDAMKRHDGERGSVRSGNQSNQANQATSSHPEVVTIRKRAGLYTHPHPVTTQ